MTLALSLPLSPPTLKTRLFPESLSQTLGILRNEHGREKNRATSSPTWARLDPTESWGS